MDNYLTDLETGDRMQFPMMPESIKVEAGTIFQSYTIMSVGDIKLPFGEELTGFSWSGILPGEKRRNDPYLRKGNIPENRNWFMNQRDWVDPWWTSAWRDPQGIQSQWSIFRRDKKKLRLLVTETPINHNVYLENYTVDYSGGLGDYKYTISFVQAKDLIINAVGLSETSGTNAQTQSRPSPPPSSSYTVVKWDSLWSIARKQMGDGTRYTELYEFNKDVIGENPNIIYPGMTLKIPI